MLPNYPSRFLPWVSLACGGTPPQSLNTQPWCQVHRGCRLSLILKYTIHAVCCWQVCNEKFFQPPQLTLPCAVHVCIKSVQPTSMSFLHRPKARCLREAARMFFLVPALRGEMGVCRVTGGGFLVFLLCPFFVKFAASCIDRSKYMHIIYHMMFNSPMLCHCIMYIWLYMSIMFFSV